ncbi:unnamed protein product [Natator depressus]
MITEHWDGEGVTRGGTALLCQFHSQLEPPCAPVLRTTDLESFTAVAGAKSPPTAPKHRALMPELTERKGVLVAP